MSLFSTVATIAAASAPTAVEPSPAANTTHEIVLSQAEVQDGQRSDQLFRELGIQKEAICIIDQQIESVLSRHTTDVDWQNMSPELTRAVVDHAAKNLGHSDPFVATEMARIVGQQGDISHAAQMNDYMHRQLSDQGMLSPQTDADWEKFAGFQYAAIFLGEDVRDLGFNMAANTCVESVVSASTDPQQKEIASDLLETMQARQLAQQAEDLIAPIIKNGLNNTYTEQLKLLEMTPELRNAVVDAAAAQLNHPNHYVSGGMAEIVESYGDDRYASEMTALVNRLSSDPKIYTANPTQEGWEGWVALQRGAIFLGEQSTNPANHAVADAALKKAAEAPNAEMAVMAKELAEIIMERRE